MSTAFLSFLLWLNFFACSWPVKEKKVEGVIQCCDYYSADPNRDPSKPPFEVTSNIYYRGNCSIQVVPRVMTVRDSTELSTFYRISHYCYLNAEKDICFDYNGFSENAKILARFKSMDSAKMTAGWNFYSEQNTLNYKYASKPGDTTINGIKYGRLKMTQSDSLYFNIYTRADWKGIPVMMYKPISDSIGCPIVGIDTYAKGRMIISRRMNLLSDKLSEDEVKIFEAWKRNEEK